MVEVVPFRGWRYDLAQVGDLSDVICPPYDVIDPAQQTALYKRHPCNAIRLELNRAEPGDASAAAGYQRAADFWKHWRLDGVLRQEHDDALYVYHQQFDWEGQTYLRRGVIARLRVEPFGTGHVFPHEQTLSGPKADRLALFHACQANLSPIFGLYPDAEGSIQQLLDDACISLTALEARDPLGVLQRMWVVTDRTVINAVRAVLREKPIYIADGHHRYETALNYRNELAEQGKLTDTNAPANFVMTHCVGMQDAGLQILPTHRLVSGFPDIDTNDLRNALSGCFEFEWMGMGPQAAAETWEMVEADGSQAAFGFGTAADGGWTYARLVDGSLMETLASAQSPAWRGLAVSRLHKLVLDRLLMTRYPEAQPKCVYVHRWEEAAEAVKQGTCQLACLIPPASIDDVEEIAGGGETMPPKSTYFYPKLLTGMVFAALT